jgi:CysZ protein
MPSLFAALARAMRDLARPRIVAVLFLPMLIAIVLWSALAFFFWDAWTGAFRDLVEGTWIVRWLAGQGATWVLETLGVVMIIALLLPATLISAMLITELIAMPVVVSVAARSHAGLERRAGGTVLGSIWNATVAVVLFALLWIATLPLWLTGIGAIVLPALNSAYLNQRLFRYDALAEHASREEYAQIVSARKLRLYALGLVLAPLYYVPVLNLAVPVLTALAFAHFCLAELAALRTNGARRVNA